MKELKEFEWKVILNALKRYCDDLEFRRWNCNEDNTRGMILHDIRFLHEEIIPKVREMAYKNVPKVKLPLFTMPKKRRTKKKQPSNL